MNDFRDDLRRATPEPPAPDIALMWANGRRAVRNRRLGIGAAAVAVIAVVGLAISQRPSGNASLDTVDEIPTDPPTTTVREVPQIDVPDGAEITVYPVGLDGWDITVVNEEDGGVTSASLHNAETDEGAFLIWSEPEPGNESLSLTYGTIVDSGFEVDLGFEDEIEVTIGWSGPDHRGSISVMGETDPEALAASIFASGWFGDPTAAPPTGWVVGLDSRLAVGGGTIRASSTNDDVFVRLATILYDDPPSAALLSNFGVWAPPPTTRSVLGAVAFQWNEFTMWTDSRALHVVEYRDEYPPEPLEEFLAALQPVTSRMVDSTDADEEPVGMNTTTSMLGPPVGPQLDDHWHAVYEIVECGQAWPIFDDQTDPNGIHTHGDGLVHIHPFSDAAVGPNATFGAFLSAMQFDADPDRLTSPISGLRLGEVDCDGQLSETRLLRWSADGLGEPPRVILGDDIRPEFFESDREVWVVARVAVSTGNDDIVVSPDRVETLDLATG